jgi:hypothetical protein
MMLNSKKCVFDVSLEKLLDYSIRDPLTPSISYEFYGWTG